MLETRLAHEPFDPAVEYQSFTVGTGGVGAIVTFTGIARATSRDGSTVEALFLDHHPGLTQGSLDQIGQSAVARFSLVAARIVHRCGNVFPGDPVVFVAAASAHRRAAFDAVDHMMDRLKSDAIFWKREQRADGSEWIEPTAADRADLTRWDAI